MCSHVLTLTQEQIQLEEIKAIDELIIKVETVAIADAKSMHLKLVKLWRC